LMKYYKQSYLDLIRTTLMWFKESGHFAKNESTESEVSYESIQNPTALHRRVQSRRGELGY
jgi:hypothetical protein